MKREKKIDNQKLRKIFLVLTLLGLLSLFYLSLFAQPKEINICHQKELKESDYVLAYGKIVSERNLTEEFFLLTLENSSCIIEITCSCNNFFNKSVLVIGRISYYNNKTQINANRIDTI
jgi:hypothetical protein